MADTTKETIIFDFQVEQGDAISDLERFKRNIIQTKEEQKQLNDAYKKGSISLDEYAKETVRLDAILKKEQTTYNDLSKAMTGTKTQTDKLIDSNNKLAKTNTDLSGKFKDVAGNINIAGTNLGSLTSGMSAFLNPVTAAGAAVGALATAYFNTGRGAADLEAIQFKLQATTEVLSNKVADFVDLIKEGDGPLKGFFNSFVDAIPGVRLFGAAWQASIGEEVSKLAEIKAQLDDLDEARTVALTKQNNLLEDNASLLEEINREQTSYQDKQDKIQQMLSNVNSAFEESLSIKRQEVALLEKEMETNKGSEELRRKINDINREISQEERKREKLYTNILKMEDNIAAAQAVKVEKLQQAAALEEQILRHKEAQIQLTGEVVEEAAIRNEVISGNEEITSSLLNMTLQTDQLSASIEKKNKATEQGIKASNAALKADKDRTGSLLVLSNAIGGAATIFEKHTIASKFLSAAQAGINSFLAGTEVLKDPSFIGRPIQRTVAMFATIAAGLAQQGKILGAFAGGGSFETKGPTWLLVGDNPGGRERVDVTPVSGKGQTKIFNDGLAMAGGGSINGSILAASSTAPLDAQFSINDAIRDLPAPIVDFQEMVSFGKKVGFKESLTTA